MNDELKYIGKPQPKFDAKERTTGRSVYGHDIELSGMLHGAILRTKYPCAEIISIDVSEAEQLAGVECVITAADIDANKISFKEDHPVLKSGLVSCIRDEIAAVAAETKEIAEQALKLIKVKYNERQGIYDPFESLEEEAVQINQWQPEDSPKNVSMTFEYEHGDLEEQKSKSKVIVKRRYHLQKMTHCCMGSSNITADYNPAEKKLTLYCGTQVPFLYQRDMAHCLKMDPSRIRVIQPVIGGGFGSKLDVNPFEPICAFLSMKTGRPVQILYSRYEEFLASPTRQSMAIDLTSGADENGRFTFREVEIIKDNGAYTSWGATTPFVMMQTFSSLYKMPACKLTSTAVYTNNPNAGSFRGYGNPQATFSVERNIDLLAEELGMDKSQIRKLNSNTPGEITGQGMHFRTCGLLEAMEIVAEKSNYESKKDMEQSGRYRRGIGLGSMLHVGGGAKIYRSDGCGTTLKLDPYGCLTIITGSSEIGQGSETVLAMIAMEEMGLSEDKIKIINSDTDVKPWDVGVHASRTSFIAGNSLLGAIGKMKEMISPRAAKLMGVEIQDLVYEKGLIRCAQSDVQIALDKVVRDLHFMPPHELAEVSYFYEPPSKYQDKGFKGDVSGNYAFAAQAIEVEVDTYTGNVKVLDVWVAQDVGKVLNPMGLQGQIEGGVVMGIGYGLTEETQMKDGYVLNPNFHNYKLLTASDVPEIHFYPVETNDPAGPYGAKGVAEAPLIPTAAAIANAVSNILGVEMNELPVTPERVLKAMKNKSELTERLV
ncbi:MAG: xanthine dehydrogenase family protein molybdopterin-binding subunit [Bacteroidetes bacterium]|nr:MAG: xanthine dehydrogenase family protein molybdopterin-binding subunit [Bacteroidota bacterium]